MAGRKRKTPVLVDDPDEPMELLEEVEDEVEAVVVEEEVQPPVPEAEGPAPVETCPSCGLPKAEFMTLRNRLRPDLKVKSIGKCPRCGTPE